ncbi:MAG: adenosine kinase [Candidatus Micrarchaeota archaeon]|nr:adenosine kinase [Candidatus Micrarchaeota archaeon]
MDLFSVGTPVIDEFAKASDAELAQLGVKKGATNFFSAKKIAAIERSLKGKITYRYPGDNARNVCEGFAALGGFCSYQGAVGDDRAGAEFEANLSECGIGAFLQVRKGSTGKIIALVTKDGERTFCADLGMSDKCDSFEKAALAESKMFYVTSITLAVPSPAARLAVKYLDAAKKMKKKIAIALESPPMVKNNRKMLLSVVKKYADVLFLNEDEADALLGADAEKKLLALKPTIPIFLKKGPHGSLVIQHKKALHVPALKAKVIDTTGAGDAYAAGVLDGMRRGFTPLSCAKRGCYLATKVVEKVGAGIPLAHTRLKIRHLRNGR